MTEAERSEILRQVAERELAAARMSDYERGLNRRYISETFRLNQLAHCKPRDEKKWRKA